MLALQKLLHESGLEGLEPLAIKHYRHPTLPLVGFKYNQIDSPRSHPVVNECRGIVLEDKTWNVVAKPFSRFFNVGEFEDEFAVFDWANCNCITKEDGSLIILYYYANAWHVNTSGSFGLGDGPNYYPGAWRDLFWEFCGFAPDSLNKLTEYTLIFELCTPWNQVVKRYNEPGVYLIGTASCMYPYWEASEKALDGLALINNWRRPNKYDVTSKEEAKALISILNDTQEVNEGVVLRDNVHRWKWKTDDYNDRHHLYDNGTILAPHRLLSLYLNNKHKDLVADDPRLKTAFWEVEFKVKFWTTDILNHYNRYYALSSQKEFALAIRGHKFFWVLFILRKLNIDPNNTVACSKEVHKVFTEKLKGVSESLFGSHTFTFDIGIK